MTRTPRNSNKSTTTSTSTNKIPRGFDSYNFKKAHWPKPTINLSFNSKISRN